MYNADLQPADFPADSLRQIPESEYESFLAKLNILHTEHLFSNPLVINHIKDPQQCIFENSKAEVGDVGNYMVVDLLKNHGIPVQHPSRVPSMHGSLLVKNRYFIVIEKDLEDPDETLCVA